MKYIYLLSSLLAPLLGFTQAKPFHIAHGCSYDEAQLESDVYVFRCLQRSRPHRARISWMPWVYKNFIVEILQTCPTRWPLPWWLMVYPLFHHFPGKIQIRRRHPLGGILCAGARDRPPPERPRFFRNGFAQTQIFLKWRPTSSGSVLRMLGATLPESQAGIETFRLQGESNTHPSKNRPARGYRRRLENATNGCGNAGRQ